MEALRNRSDAARIVAWLMGLGRRGEYRLAAELERVNVEVSPGKGERAGSPDGARKKRRRRRMPTGL
jgi:hypothetical protein